MQPERPQEEPEEQPLKAESKHSQSMPLVEPSVWRPDPLLEKPEGASPPHSEPGRQSFGDGDGAESWATVRTARDSFETASTSHQHMQERCMSDCSDRDDQQPVLTGTGRLCRPCTLLSCTTCIVLLHVMVMCQRQALHMQATGPSASRGRCRRMRTN